MGSAAFYTAAGAWVRGVGGAVADESCGNGAGGCVLTGEMDRITLPAVASFAPVLMTVAPMGDGPVWAQYGFAGLVGLFVAFLFDRYRARDNRNDALADQLATLVRDASSAIATSSAALSASTTALTVNAQAMDRIAEVLDRMERAVAGCPGNRKESK